MSPVLYLVFPFVPLWIPLIAVVTGRFRVARAATIGVLIGGLPGWVIGLASCTYAARGPFPAPSPGVPGQELSWALLGLGAFQFGGIGGILGGLIGIAVMRAGANRALQGRCSHCGYDLRGLLERRCPECGKSF